MISSTAELQRPPVPRVGETVAVVAPSGQPVAVALERAAALLAEWGLRAQLSQVARQGRGYLAGESDAARAAALQAALLDPQVAAVWCIRGGYGATRLLRLLDWERLRREAAPKLFCGYSD